jgi:hypothetical protein
MFALPLLKPVIGTLNNSITTFENQKIKIYGFNNVSPEMIWYYGTEIPQIKSEDGSFDFPDENQFGILAYNMTSEDLTALQENYEIQKVDTLDLNTVSSESKRYNNRLVNDFYILTRR